MSRIEVITGVERRRRYSDAERAAILAKCDEPGSTIVGIGKTLGISPSLIHTWKRMRREVERIASEPMQFIPYGSVPNVPSPTALTTVTPAPVAAPPSPPPTLAEELVRPFPGARPGVIDIDLRNRIRLAVDTIPTVLPASSRPWRAGRKLNGVNPRSWLADVLDRIGKGHPINRIDELLPWAWGQSQAPTSGRTSA